MDSEFSSFYKQFSSLSGIEKADLELVLPYLEKRGLKKGTISLQKGIIANILVLLAKVLSEFI